MFLFLSTYGPFLAFHSRDIRLSASQILTLSTDFGLFDRPTG